MSGAPFCDTREAKVRWLEGFGWEHVGEPPGDGHEATARTWVHAPGPAINRPLPPGTRVRNYGEQFPRAYHEGTATVVDSKHIKGYGTEFNVHTDDGRDTWWSDDATYPIRLREEEQA